MRSIEAMQREGREHDAAIKAERERRHKLGLCQGCGQPEAAHRYVVAVGNSAVCICPTSMYRAPEKP